MMLDVRDLHAYYGKSHILQGVSLCVGTGEIVSVLGRNGVGRSTTLKTIMGDVPPHGSITFKDEAITGLKPFEIAQRGIGYVPEDRAIFPTLTVEQNLILGIKAGKKASRWCMADTYELFPRLEERAKAPAERDGVEHPGRGGRITRASLTPCASHAALSPLALRNSFPLAPFLSGTPSPWPPSSRARKGEREMRSMRTLSRSPRLARRLTPGLISPTRAATRGFGLQVVGV